ncbi:type I asparaginase [Marinilongibacter aquaticus]|uniref:asparaginase n=1 Tax=Marinilongibacter aquaticus TaxID=2975157 RepID=UPI0021BD0763|nr:type I asparaginase [Marinilongibacter aquaticus]UBM58496.1 type I asparaginase [Marinilongibacter aquaticus]
MVRDLLHIETASEIGGPRILMIYTGGTLGMVYDYELKTLVPLEFSELSKSLPELMRLELSLSIVSIDPPIDSSDMQPEVWQELASIVEEYYADFDGFVVLHGTDTMAFTASALSFMCENLAKPVIFTGAQLPIGVARTDARENIITALELAADRVEGSSVLHEVCIYFNGRLLRGNRAKKYESSQFDAFQSENYPMLAEVGVYCQYNFPYLQSKPKGDFKVHKKLEKGIVIVKLFPGMDLDVYESVFQHKSVRAVILETYGSGNASTKPSFLEALAKASQKGLVLYNVSQCVGGQVRQQDYASGLGLKNIGVISGKDITTEAAVAKLMFLLGQNLDSEETKRLLEINLRGEMAN